MKLILLLLLAVFTCSLFALSFEAEELEFTIHKGYWEMDGLFHFANYADTLKSIPIYFPIPEDSLSLHPEIIALEVVEDSLASCMLSSVQTGGFAFVLSMPAQHFCTVRIAYRQTLIGEKAKYIITTANSWGKPLAYASYKLKVADGISISKLPFPKQQHTADTYFWEFSSFSPATEFEVLFQHR
ncbi:MAG: hypothetical protein PHY48_01425 [Candidatus Cloacimonetes bacterium]|nr:hypothetical protein [Candidatus Cloacimonadota bacterium]